MKTLTQIRHILAEQLHHPLADITPYHTLAQLGADSLDIVDIACAIEDRCRVIIPVGDLALHPAVTVGQLASHISVHQCPSVVQNSSPRGRS
jgi:acyl carrier protein